ncbi:MAG: T9SS type A sorting domain-containing protein, partial [Elusimicrobia bacterium]|nr:T9SS type A sorting domain-containing protein [Elusimicrobiota bacterium]
NDGIADRVLDGGGGKPLYFLGDALGNFYAVSDQALTLSAYSNNTTQVTATWASTPIASGYQMAAGADYNSPTSFSTWTDVGPRSSGTPGGLGLPTGRIQRLAATIDANATQLTVTDATGLPASVGALWVGSEIIGVQRVSGTNTYNTYQYTGCPLPSGRGCGGSIPQPHIAGEAASVNGVILSVRGYVKNSTGTITAYIPSAQGRPIQVLRVDTSQPGSPATVGAQVPQGLSAGPSYVVTWALLGGGTTSGLKTAAGAYRVRQSGAGVPDSLLMAYELQERVGTDPVWRTIAFLPTQKAGGIDNNSYQVGNPAVNPWESPRQQGTYFTYRVRAWSNSGVASEWSPESASVATALLNTPLSKVSNFPNPFDSRKGGPQGHTTITYLLAADSSVDITIYDMLGYVVKSMSFQPGTEGGKAGPNFVPWDGRNGEGRYVSKGGYIARIKAGSSVGTSTVIRKIGVIH